MSFLNKLGIGGTGEAARTARTIAHGANAKPPVAAAAGAGSRGAEPHVATRVSNGLKEFLWNLDGLGRGTLLDLGPAWQTTLNFFIERGFRVSSEDILRGWKAFLDEEEGRMAVLRGGALREDASRDSLDMTPEGRAARFFKTNLQYAPASFDAVLLWDVLDYLDPAMTKQTITCLTELLRPAGIVFAMFHSKKPEGFQRYRVADSNTLQVIPANIVTPAQKVYQNREIQDLFSVYRTTKSFVGRDQLRETLFIK
jgi:hypothetical protein